jgi:hypothetical protein
MEVLSAPVRCVGVGLDQASACVLPSIRARQYSGRSAFPEALVRRWRGPGGGKTA